MNSTNQHVWDTRYVSSDVASNMKYTPWLDRWSELLKGGAALDIGCGLGFDTEKLNELGFTVTAVDLSPEALKRSQARNPGSKHIQRDIAEGLQLGGQSFSVVVANLSLHYFSRTITMKIFEDVAQVMREGGVFAFRVNAFGDVNYGSPDAYPGWDLVATENVTKQFFTEEKIREALGDRFEVLSIEEFTVLRYGAPKVLLECVARKQ